MTEVLFKLFDLLLGGLLSKWRDRKALVSEFEALKRRVLYVGVVNNLPVELHHLRAFLIDKGLVERPGVSEFFSKWLTNFVVVTGVPALNVFSSEAVKELQSELSILRL